MKNVSKADRLTVAGSASTCPKSGLIVAVSVSPGVSAYLMSTPAEAAADDASTSGLPLACCRVRLATVYGVNSRRFTARPVSTPDSSPNDDTYPFALRASSGHVEVAFRRPTSRAMAKPKVFVSAGLNRSCENGILNSASQPRSSRDTVTSHTASQLISLFVSLNQ